MQIRTYVGVSIDGFMAMPDGLPAWFALPTFVGGASHGYPEYIEQCEAVVVGRTTFDQGHAHWTEQSAWPWEGFKVYVLTSRLLPANTHMDVFASNGGPSGLLEQLRNADLARDVNLLGGARSIQAFLQLGAVDHLGICILPVVLGEGVPLFAAGAAPRTSVRLNRHRAFPDGAVQLIYAAS